MDCFLIFQKIDTYILCFLNHNYPNLAYKNMTWQPSSKGNKWSQIMQVKCPCRLRVNGEAELI